jgi:MFS family permease
MVCDNLLPLPPMVVKEQAGPSAEQAIASKRPTTWWPLAVLVAINVLNFYDRQVAGAVVEPVRKEFHLTDTEIGLLNTLSLILYGLVGLPLGLLADRVSRKKLLAAGICTMGP